MDILQDGVRRYFSSLPPPDPTTYPDRYYTIISHQNNIGWEHLFQARWCKQWGHMQETYRTTLTTTVDAVPGSTWVHRMGRLLLDGWLDLWQQRNLERHGKDQIQQDAFRIQVLTQQLTDLYSYKMKVCPTERPLFYSTVAEHLQHHTSPAQIEDWITMYKDAIRASAQQATTLGISRNRTILDYPTFNPTIQTRQKASLTAGLLPG